MSWLAFFAICFCALCLTKCVDSYALARADWCPWCPHCRDPEDEGIAE